VFHRPAGVEACVQNAFGQERCAFSGELCCFFGESEDTGQAIDDSTTCIHEVGILEMKNVKA